MYVFAPKTHLPLELRFPARDHVPGRPGGVGDQPMPAWAHIVPQRGAAGQPITASRLAGDQATLVNAVIAAVDRASLRMGKVSDDWQVQSVAWRDALKELEKDAAGDAHDLITN